jgi:hypothetical protein
VVSEDSDQIVPRLSSVHRLRNFRDLDKPIKISMAISRDQLDASRELLEVDLLRAQHAVLPEERDDRSEEIQTPSHDIPIQVLTMVVVTLVREDLTYTEELVELVKAGNALGALRHHDSCVTW